MPPRDALWLAKAGLAESGILAGWQGAVKRHSPALALQENCKLGVWSIFRPARLNFAVGAVAENMDLTPSR